MLLDSNSSCHFEACISGEGSYFEKRVTGVAIVNFIVALLLGFIAVITQF
jgi:hypothetical protein